MSHAHTLPTLCAALLCATAQLAHANDYYLAPTGSDTNPGTMAQPFGTLKKAASVAMPGDVVYLRGGTYRVVEPDTTNAGIAITKSGKSDSERICFWAFPGETPVFDFADLKISTTTYTNGFTVSGSYLHFRGLEIKNVPMHIYSNNGMSVSNASNDIFELLDLHHNNGTGLFIGKGGGGHRVADCDSHDNYDPTSNQGDGQNADGFGLHYQVSGAPSTFSGCRAWWNSDDGYDFINQEVSGVIENSWAMGNGYIRSGSARPAAGNGNGFKVGSSKTGVRHVVRNNVAWKNVINGFYANHSSGGNDWYNNTSYNNGVQYNMLASDPNDVSIKITLMGARVHRMRNNIGLPNRNSNMEGVDTASNTWDLGITPMAADFASVEDAGFMGPRQADGRLPDIAFLKLRAGSPMIDKGVDVGLPFAGSAPDLGAVETGLERATPPTTMTTTTTMTTASTTAGGPSIAGASAAGPSAGVAGNHDKTSPVGGAAGRSQAAGSAMAQANGVGGRGGAGQAGQVGVSVQSTGASGAGSAAMAATAESSRVASCGCQLTGRHSQPGAAWFAYAVGLMAATRRLRSARSSRNTAEARPA